MAHVRPGRKAKQRRKDVSDANEKKREKWKLERQIAELAVASPASENNKVRGKPSRRNRRLAE